MTKSRNCSVDIFRLLCAVLVVAIHTNTFEDQNAVLGFIAVRVITRIAVPFFFIVSGYYYISKLERGEKCMASTLWKTFKLYTFWSAVYIAINAITFVLFSEKTVASVTAFISENLFKFFFLGTEYHLWFFIALLVSIVIIGVAYRLKIQKPVIALTLLLFVFGLLGESYHAIGSKIPLFFQLTNLAHYNDFKHVFLMGLPFFSSGYFAIKLKGKESSKGALVKTIVMAMVFLLEIAVILKLDLPLRGKGIEITFFLYPLTLYTFITLLKNSLPQFESFSAKTRSLANYIYYSHPIFIMGLDIVCRRIDLSLLNALKTCLVVLLCFLTWLILRRINKPKFIKKYAL